MIAANKAATVPFAILKICSFPHSWLITGLVIKVAW